MDTIRGYDTIAEKRIRRKWIDPPLEARIVSPKTNVSDVSYNPDPYARHEQWLVTSTHTNGQ